MGTSASIEDMAEKFALLNDAIEVCDNGKGPKATAEDRMRYDVLMGLMGKAHWLNCATWQEPTRRPARFPGWPPMPLRTAWHSCSAERHRGGRFRRRLCK